MAEVVAKYSPDQARDDHGRWSSGGGGSSDGGGGSGSDNVQQASEPDPDAHVATDYESIQEPAADPDGNYYGECVSLVKQATNLPATRDWVAGAAIKEMGNPPLKPGTAIATFDESGHYPQGSQPKHAAIFMGYEKKGGELGMNVYDQYWDKKYNPPELIGPAKRWIGFNDSKRPQNNAGAYSVIHTK